jgi:uncharacterized protein YchJ
VLWSAARGRHARTDCRTTDEIALLRIRGRRRGLPARLDVERCDKGGPFDSTGVVEFTAYGRQGGVRSAQHEVSRFIRVNRRWYYLDGEV